MPNFNAFCNIFFRKIFLALMLTFVEESTYIFSSIYIIHIDIKEKRKEYNNFFLEKIF